MSEEKGKEEHLFDTNDSDKLSKLAHFKFCLVLIIGLAGISLITIGIITFRAITNKTEEKITGTYAIHISAEDYGCGVDKIILSLDKELESVDKNAFIIEETKYFPNTTNTSEPEIEQTSNRTILSAYLSDEKGNKLNKASKYVSIELQISPIEGSPLIYFIYNAWSSQYYLTIKLAENKKLSSSNGEKYDIIEIERNYTKKTSPADKWKYKQEKYGKYKYNMAIYEPEEKSKNLFVWLNGAGEGGSETLGNRTSAEVTILANKVTALAGPKFQRRIGGANILVPQAPTMWMDDGKGNLVAGERKSIYLDSLIELIDEYVKENDIKNVFIGGCSNGGYMTMNIAMDYGTKYQGYVPICEAMADEKITDEDIEVLKDVPIYFVYSLDDTTVNPSMFEEPTIKRMKEAGAKDLHVSTTYHVVDTSGKYKDENGDPWQYYGHLSWIYFFNGETSCDLCEVSAFDWMGQIVKERE